MSMDSKGRQLMESFVIGNGEEHMYLSTDVTNNLMTGSLLPIIDQNSRNLSFMNIKESSIVNLDTNTKTLNALSRSLQNKFNRPTDASFFSSTVKPLDETSFQQINLENIRADSKKKQALPLGDCFEKVIRDRAKIGLPKEVSFKKPEYQEHIMKQLTAEEIRERKQKKLHRSPRENMIINTKVQLH